MINNFIEGKDKKKSENPLHLTIKYLYLHPLNSNKV